MSEEKQGWQRDQPEGDRITLHLLREVDFPWLLLWMVKESQASLSWLVQTTRSTPEINIVTGTLNGRERVSLLTAYSSNFTRLKTGYTLEAGEWSIQQLQLNPLIYGKSVLAEVLPVYLDYLVTEWSAKKVFWEINHVDKLFIELALAAGFLQSPVQDQVQFTLYEYAGNAERSRS